MQKKVLTYSELAGAEQKTFDKVGKVSTESVFKHTGKHWAQWVPLLIRAGARSWTYQEIVGFLKKKHKLTPWWQQGVALGFEVAIGRRKEGQDAKGNYMVTATKSLPFGSQTVWKTLASKSGLAIWMRPLSPISLKPKTQFETEDGFFGEIRTIAAHRRVRMYWQDPLWEKHTVVELMVVKRPNAKTILVFNHTGIKDLKTKSLLRNRWKNVLEELLLSLRGE